MFLGTPKAWDEHYRNCCQTQAKPAGGESFIKKGGGRIEIENQFELIAEKGIKA